MFALTPARAHVHAHASSRGNWNACGREVRSPGTVVEPLDRRGVHPHQLHQRDPSPHSRRRVQLQRCGIQHYNSCGGRITGEAQGCECGHEVDVLQMPGGSADFAGSRG